MSEDDNQQSDQSTKLSWVASQEEQDTVKLLYCASRGDLTGLKQALSEGVNKNVADYDKRTALHLAASEGHTACVQLLVNSKVELNPKDRWGRTPLADARRYGHKKICKILDAQGAIDFEAVSPEYEIDPTEIEEIGNGRAIAFGAFGEIRLVKWRGTKVAAKTILNTLSADQEVIRDFITELVLLQKLHHPNIVQFLGAVTEKHPLVILTEYLPGGDLQALIRRRGPLGLKQILRFSLDIARGMNFLHQHKPQPVIHRDLKPTNILMDDAGHLKVADFGLSRLVRASGATLNEVYNMTGETGSYRYMAPEVYRHEAYDTSVDVFSFAMVVYEMLEGAPAHKYEHPLVAIKQRAFENVRPVFTTKCPSKLKQLLKECWHEEPKKRPGFRKIIQELEDMEKSLHKLECVLFPCFVGVRNSSTRVRGGDPVRVTNISWLPCA